MRKRSDPNVLDTHIIERQRKMILKEGGLNKQINKYLDVLDISQEKFDEENIIHSFEKLIGRELNDEEKKLAIAWWCCVLFGS